MAVLVDQPVFCRGNRLDYCHLMSDKPDMSDALAELHIFAASIGLRRSWFQAKSSPHYDLSPFYRRKAIAAGAEEVSNKELVKRCIKIHRKQADSE